MKMDIVAGSQNDEFYTPKYAVKPILEFLKPKSLVWCPFDLHESNFRKVLDSAGHQVLTTHIKEGQDFFLTPAPTYADYIISNPPYSKKTEVLEKLFAEDKPFAMLVGVVGLFESRRRFELFQKNDFEILYFDKRISFLKDMADTKPALNPPFSSVYICRGFLPDKICFRKLTKEG